MTVNAHQAKTYFSRLLARLVPIREKPAPRVPGLDAGKVWISPDFDAPLPKNLLAQFYK